MIFNTASIIEANMEAQMDIEVDIAAVAGTLLSLGFSYIPGLDERYQALDGSRKRLVMLFMLLVTAVGIFTLRCIPGTDGLGVPPGTCDQPGAWGLARLFVVAALANQGTFLLSPKPAK